MKSRRHRAINWAKLGRKVKNAKVIPYKAVFTRLEDGTGVHVIDKNNNTINTKTVEAVRKWIEGIPAHTLTDKSGNTVTINSRGMIFKKADETAAISVKKSNENGFKKSLDNLKYSIKEVFNKWLRR